MVIRVIRIIRVIGVVRVIRVTMRPRNRPGLPGFFSQLVILKLFRY
jgi:hypothetical protein